MWHLADLTETGIRNELMYFGHLDEPPEGRFRSFGAMPFMQWTMTKYSPTKNTK